MSPDHRAPRGRAVADAPSVDPAGAQPSSDGERAHFVRYTRPERWPMLDRFPVLAEVQDTMLGQMLGWSPQQVRDCVGALTSTAAELAGEMMTDPIFRTAVDSLPFRAGDRVAAVGDSLTADRLGWFDLMVASMHVSGDNGVVTHNLGLSGSTTADALERFDILEAFQPTHVLVMLGTNDARRHGRRRHHRMVSPAETGRNLSALIDLVVNDLSAQVVILTPPPADQTRISAFFDDSTVGWSAAEIDAVATVVRAVAPGCIDVHRMLDTDRRGESMESDGVHLNPTGQQALTRAVVGALAIGLPSTRAPEMSPASGT